jgi:hypothetical protein
MRASIVLAGMLLAAPALAAGPFGAFSVENWKGGAFTNNQTGRFSHCALSASYKSGVVMHASVNANLGWSLGFSNRAWGLKPGSSVAMTMVFDRNDTVRINATAVQPQLVVVQMPPNSDIVRAFRGAQFLEINMLGARYTFRLTSTSRIMPALVECVNANRNLAVAPGTTGPQGAAPPGGTAAANPALQLEAVTLATNFLLRTQLPDSRVLGGSETPAGLGTNGVAWTAANATGVVRVLGSGTGRDIDVAAAVSAADSRRCTGKFASGRTTDTIEERSLLRGFSSCEVDGRTRYSEYYVIPRKQGGFAMFSVVTSGDSALHQERRATFQRAALTAAQ